MSLHCVEFGVYIISGSNLYQENNFKPCLTKQLLNAFKLWCESGISLLLIKFFVIVHGAVHIKIIQFTTGGNKYLSNMLTEKTGR